MKLNQKPMRQVLAPVVRHRGAKHRMKPAPHPFFVALAARRAAIAAEAAAEREAGR